MRARDAEALTIERIVQGFARVYVVRTWKGRISLVDTDKAREIEQKIAELKRRWPVHSVPPGLWRELEDLEDELKGVAGAGSEETDGGQGRSGRLS